MTSEKRKRDSVKVGLAGIIAVLAFVIVGCGGGSSSTSQSTAGDTSANESTPSETGTNDTSAEETNSGEEEKTASGPELTIGYSDPFGSEEGLRSIAYGEQQAIKQLGLNWKVKEVDAKLSPEKQVSDIESMMAQKIPAITTWTVDQGAAESTYEKAAAAGVALIGFNSESPSFDSVIAGDTDLSCHVSEEQAEYIAERIPNAKILMLGGPPVPSITYTTKCFQKAAQKAGLDVIEEQNDTTATPAGGQEVASAMLLKNADAEAMWTFSESSGLGAAAALKAAGKTAWSGEDEGFIIVSRNGTAAGAAAVKNGELTATWDNNQPLLGAAAIQVLKYHFVDGVPLDKLPKRVRIESKVWDKEDIESYESPLEREVPLPLPEKMK